MSDVTDLLDGLASAAPTLNLFPTENRMSRAALRVLGSDLCSRYPGSEGDIFLYGDPYELSSLYRMCADLACAYFGARHAFVNLLSGLHAMQSMLGTLCRAGDEVVILDPDGGGHYATQQICENFGLHVRTVPVYRSDLLLDVDQLARTAQERPVDLLYLDMSTSLRLPRPADLRAAVGPQTIICLDASHLLGLLPTAFGAELFEHIDLCTASTHKTFPGPQKAIILTSSDAHASTVEAALPFKVSSGHTNCIGALAVTLDELMPHRVGYGASIVSNAQAFAAALAERGHDVAGADFGFTETHQVWIAPPETLDPLHWGRALRAAGIRSTSVTLPSHGRVGLRLGLQELTRTGATAEFSRAAAHIVSAALDPAADVARLRNGVRELVSGLSVTNVFPAPVIGKASR